MNNSNTKNSNKNLKPFIAPGSNVKVTQEDIEKRKRRIKRAEEIGQSLTRVDDIDNGYENPYRAKALCYILKDKEVPDELKQMIKEFDRKHVIRKTQEQNKNKHNN